MEPDEQQLELLGALEALGGSAGNGRLREVLGWDEASYEAVKAPLITSGKLRAGRGRGGSVSLAEAAQEEPSEEGAITAPQNYKVQLIDASGFWQKMRKSLGSKRKELSPGHIDEITRLFGTFEEAEQDGKPISGIFRNEDFGYRTITVERPVRDEAGKVVLGQRGKSKGEPQADSSLRDTENVPLSEDVQTYFEREVLPHVSDAWIDHDKTKVGYEIPFNRHFYVFTPPRPLEVIDAELKQVTDRILAMIGGLSG